MPRQSITNEWSIELGNEFRRRAESGDLMFWDGARRTVYAAVFETGTAEADEAIGRMLEGRPGEAAKTYDRVEAGLAGHAYLLPEGRDGQQYWGLNTWTAAKGSVACVTFYFEDGDELSWALQAWKS